MVFQQFYLFPHLTALENVMFGPLRVRGANKEEAEKLARELLAKIGFAEKVASRLIFIDKGRIAEDGDPQVLIKNPPSQRLQEFLQHVS